MKENLIKRIELGFNDGVAPNIACGVVRSGSVVFEHYCHTSPSDLFDLASLTKVVFMTTLCAQQVQQGALDLAKPIDKVLTGYTWGKCTIEDLLTHQSGLPAWIDCKGLDKTSLVSSIADVFSPGYYKKTTRYSDVGFMLLGLVLEKELGMSLDDLYLGLPGVVNGNVYGWEKLQGDACGRVLPTGNSACRKNICGDVHDDNSFFLAGMQPHAGLFASLVALIRFLPVWMKGSAALTEATRNTFFTPICAMDGSKHAVGWDIPTENSSAGKGAPAHLVGHLGYTGTSIWIDPLRDLGVVLLTNRTAHATSPEMIKKFRQDVHSIIWKSAI